MAENTIESPPKVLFYGSILPCEVGKVKSLLQVFVPELLNQGCVVTTREGAFQETDGQVWLDNIILDIAIAHRNKEKLDYSSVISFVSVDDHKPSPHDRKMLRLSGHGRLQLYRQLLDKCDVVFLLGGREGVYRLSLFAHARQHLIIPFAIATGTATEVATEFADEMLKLPDSINLVASSVCSIGQADCHRAVSDLKKEVFRRRTGSVLHGGNPNLDGSISLRDAIKLLGAMKLSALSALFGVIFAIAVSCFQLGMFVADLDKSIVRKTAPQATINVLHKEKE